MMQRCLLASSNNSRTRFAPVPAYSSMKSEPVVAMKLTPLSPETAFASSVFPVPGGPRRRAPFGIFAPRSV
eukprot:gene3654-gene2192